MFHDIVNRGDKMSIMTQLEFELNFSNSEKEIAKYILNNGEAVLEQSVQQLARSTYTSPATIVRLCQKLGLQGYLDFKIKYSAELQYDSSKKRTDVNFPFAEDASYKEITKSLANVYQETIEDTLQLIDYKQLDIISQALQKAERIYIFCCGNSMLAGLNFQHKMLRIGKLVEMRSLTGEQIFLSYNATKKDIAIVISYSGETPEVIECTKQLHKNHVSIIAITSLGENQLSKYASYTLNTSSREKIFNKIAPIASFTSMTYLLDLLFSCIFNNDYQKNYQRKIGQDRTNDLRHPLLSPINEEIYETNNSNK